MKLPSDVVPVSPADPVEPGSVGAAVADVGGSGSPVVDAELPSAVVEERVARPDSPELTAPVESVPSVSTAGPHPSPRRAKTPHSYRKPTIEPQATLQKLPKQPRTEAAAVSLAEPPRRDTTRRLETRSTAEG